MHLRIVALICTLAISLLTWACSQSNSPVTNSPASAKPAQPEVPSALPDEACKAEITIVSPPTKLRAGEKIVVQVKIKNASSVQWWARGAPVNTRADNKFYIAAGNRWLKADGSKLTDMDGRYGVSKDLKPGEEEEVPLSITAPKDPGEYVLEVDVVQEGVTWFSDKGSPTAKTKVAVVR
jgi:hypothetical protein